MKLNVGIIDIFSKKARYTPINQINADYSHGQVIYGIFQNYTNGLPINVHLYKVKPQRESKALFNTKSLLKTLKKINRTDEKLDYLNISTVIDYPFPSEENLLYSRGKIICTLPAHFQNIIFELQQIIDRGTQVFVPAGNNNNQFNILSLADGVHCIGGLDRNTHTPIKRFSISPLVEKYIELPYFISTKKIPNINSHKSSKNFPVPHEMRSFSKSKLTTCRATKKDYETLKTIVDSLNDKKYTFDLDFLHFLLPIKVPRHFSKKIFLTDTYIEILGKNFAPEVLEYTFPKGNYCDLRFRNFFDLREKNNCIFPQRETTTIPITISGTCVSSIIEFSNKIKQGLLQIQR